MLRSTFWATELQHSSISLQDPFFPAASKVHDHQRAIQRKRNQRTGVANTGGNGYLSLGAGGLVMDGGNGIDGETLLAGSIRSRWAGRCCWKPSA
jgi:hypothetical protein